MLFQGKTISVKKNANGIAQMLFNSPQSVNTFNQATIEELKESIALLQAEKDIKGLVVESAKSTFIAGADITEFHGLFTLSEEEIQQAVVDFNHIFVDFENLPFPTVAVVNGVALGGGMEMALSCDYRVSGPNGRFGLPEVKLGINPGFGGTIRLPRLIGIDNAVEWIATGNEYKAEAALKVGAVDALVAEDQLQAAAEKIIQQVIEGDLDYLAKRKEKQEPVKLNDMERLMAFTTAKGLVAQQAGPNMPAPVTAVKSIEQSAALNHIDAINIEAKFFARLAKTEVSGNLVALFLNQQELASRTDKLTKDAASSENITVVGAGIMGGGIAYQSAYRGKRVLMKDIAQKGLDQGMEEATKLLAKRVERGRMTPLKMAETIARIKPTLSDAEFNQTDIAIEAVVENLKVKQAVLKDTESKLKTDAVMASNTSTISISTMAESLQRPENFCGMHFFNPVHKMPLVEVIRGEKTSEQTIARVVKLAKDMGKTPIVVNDCAGFYVNRVLFPYLAGFNLLLSEGADFQHIDKVMEKFGWPMGPAYLIDVVGLDTADHAAETMAEAFPERMGGNKESALHALYQQQRLGQKNGLGFYRYENDKKGKPKKVVDESVNAIIQSVVKNQASANISDEDIIQRLMIPMCLEVVRCLDESIVANAVDADMGVLMGIGFPLFRGGAVRYMENVGLANIVEQAKKYQHLGGLYEVPQSLLDKAQNNQSYFA